jgi:hypothetical protein
MHGVNNTKSHSVCMRFEDLDPPSVYIVLCGRLSLGSASSQDATFQALGF